MFNSTKLFLPTFFAFLICVVATFGQDSDLIKKEVRVHLNSAQPLENDAKYQEAIAEVNQAIEIEPDNFDLYLSRASILYSLKNNKSAFEDVKKAFSFGSNYLNPRIIIERLCDSRQYEEALKIDDYATSHKKPTRLRYLIKFRMKDYDGTIKEIIADKNFVDATFDCIKLCDTADGKNRPCEEILTETLTALKNDPHILDYYQKIFEYIKFDKEQENLFGGTIGGMVISHAFLVKIYKNYALFCEETKTPTEIAVIYDQIAAEQSLPTRAEIFKAIGKYQAAIKDLTEFINLNPDISNYEKEVYIYQRGDLYVLTKQFDEAIADYKMAKALVRAVEKTHDAIFYDRLNEQITRVKQLQLAEQNKIK